MYDSLMKICPPYPPIHPQAQNGLARGLQMGHSSRPMHSLRYSFGLLALSCVVWLWMASAPTAAGIYKTDIEISGDAETVVLHLDQAAAPLKEFTLENPPRIAIDLPASVSGEGVGLSSSYPGRLINGIRFGRPTPDRSRVVIDLKHPISNYQIAGSLTPPRIAIRLPAPASLATQQAPVTRVDNTNYWQQPATQHATAQPPVAQQPPSQQPTGLIPAPAPKPVEDVKEATKPIIVIDAGHGGKDTGAIGVSGVHEKNITLAYANAFKEALLRSGRYRVVLTRESDVYLFLKERVDIARKNKGVFFISLHADSNPNPKATGLSIYTISEQASDAESAALAAQENKSDIIGGIDLSVEDENVANILIDLAQRETRNKASALAESLIENMHPKIPLLGNTHRFAGFRVLKAPDIPSVLIEIGFLSNPADERRLQSIEYKDKVVRSLVDGLDAYLAQ